MSLEPDSLDAPELHYSAPRPGRARTYGGKFSVWVKLNGTSWRIAFASNDYSDARHWSREHIRYGGAVEKIELRDLSGKVEPIYDMTWPR